MKDALDRLQVFFTPQKLYSWQTAIALCLLAWLLALITTQPIQFLLVKMGWIFLIIGVGWMTTENPVQVWGLSLSPWITGLLVCIFLFVSDWRSGVPRIAFILWPVTSALIAAFPSTFSPELGFRIPPVSVRPRLLIVLLSNFLVLCWILFYFQIQDWLETYPELRQESFKKSGFVVAIGRPDMAASRGIQVTNLMAEEVILRANGNTRSEVERWLFDLQNQKDAPNQFRAKVMERLIALDQSRQSDEAFWQLEIVIAEPEYQMILGARWMGPSASKGKYMVQQACQISFAGTKPTDLARVECLPAQRIDAKG
jgi:hypothetical protein